MIENIKKKLQHAYLAAGVAITPLYTHASLTGGSTSKTLGDSADSGRAEMSSILQLILGGAMLLGVFFIITGIIGLKSKNSQKTQGDCWKEIGGGVALTMVMFIVYLIANSFGGGDATKAAHTLVG